MSYLSSSRVLFNTRFKKLSSEGSQSTDIVVKKEATSERNLRPLLFKFNEVQDYSWCLNSFIV